MTLCVLGVGSAPIGPPSLASRKYTFPSLRATANVVEPASKTLSRRRLNRTYKIDGCVDCGCKRA